LRVLITGASAGIGRDLALLLGDKKLEVIATGRDSAKLESLAKQARAQGAPNFRTLQLDVTSQASIEGAARTVHGWTGGEPIDALVNNAGYNHAGPLLDLTVDELRAQFETNVFGQLAVTQAFLPSMLQKPGTRVINVSSVNGRFTFPLYGAYTASKYALESLTDALRIEVEPFGTWVVLIEPGSVKTEFGSLAVNKIKERSAKGSLYGEVLRGVDALKKEFDASSIEPRQVSNAIYLALTAKKPKARYLVPSAAKIFLSVMKALPTRTVDAMLRKKVGLTEVNLRAARALIASKPLPALDALNAGASSGGAE
jgi:short-subunit dehydrogenase